MITINHELDCHCKPIEIVPLADLHIGDREHDPKILDHWLHWLDGSKNRYMLLCGDLMNVAIKTSISDTYTETLTPAEQLEKCIKIFGKYRDRILCITSGNHEERISKLVNLSPDRLFATQLGLESLYTDTSCVVFLKFGETKKHKKLCYSIYVNHGSGGGRKAGGKINRLIDYAQIVDADIYVVGHTHSPISCKQGRYKTNPQSGTVTYKESVFVNTASMLTYGGYGDRQGYTPASNSYPVLVLDNTKYDVKVIL